MKNKFTKPFLHWQVDSGHQWYLQVIYLIGPADMPFHRHRRAALAPTPAVPPTNVRPYADPYSGLKLDKPRNGTNMKQILLDQPSRDRSSPTFYPIFVVVPAVVFILVVFTITIIVVCIRKRRRKRKRAECVTVKQNNLVQTRRSLGVSVTSVASPSSSVSQQNLKRVSSKGEIKTLANAAKCNIIKAKDVNVITQNSINMDSGTEV
ncbi:hypothetical protein BaRGS_00010215 [Batillaria attramentaria]|uniref:Uncharacterized protein n=1 Tax=Batillaria attramentaria TaxID=370345 RepID=A0ABD0LGK6_9CAEN